MKLYIQSAFLLLAVIFFSCKQLTISDEETKGINEIASLYGGSLSYTIKLNASTSSGKTKLFEIELKNSDIIDQNQGLTEMFASHIAYTFFKYSKGQKTPYNSITTTIYFKEGEKATFEYSSELLELVDTKLKYVQQIVDILKAKEYNKIRNTIETGPVLLEENKIKYIEKLKSMDSTFGDIHEFTLSGFRISSGVQNMRILHISGSLKRSKTNTQFSIDINPESGQQGFYYIDYYF